MEVVEKQVPPRPRGRFACSHCVKHFNRHEHLQRHERLHTREKPFRCDQCPHAFTRRDLLVRHVRLAHGNLDPAPSPFRSVNINTSSFGKKKERLTRVLNPSVIKTSATTCNEHPLIAASANSQDDTTSQVPQSFDNASDKTLSTVNDVANDAFLMVDSLWPLNFDIDQFMVFPPVSPYTEPLSLTGQDNIASVLRPAAQEQQHLPPPRTSSDALMGVEEMSVSRSTEQQLYWSFTDGEWLSFCTEIEPFCVTSGCPFPSRQSMSRYIAAYFRSFHANLPFLHAPSINLEVLPAHLSIAIATIGAQYCLETTTVDLLFAIGKTMVLNKIETRRKTPVCRATSHPYSGADQPAEASSQGEPNHICQTLLLLMVVATWGNIKSTHNEDLILQSVLASFMREENLIEMNSTNHTSWLEWVRSEGARRTILIIFCFFNFHSILYNIPSPILNSEIHMSLPCTEEEWSSDTDASWQEYHKNADTQPTFAQAFRRLFQSNEQTSLHPCSSLGVYILISGVIQRIYYVRQMGNTIADQGAVIEPVAADDLRRALGQWRQLWEMDPHRSASPGNPHGPLPFNSIAQFRMAYIRLSVDIGSFFTLKSHDPEQIAHQMVCSPTAPRNQHSTRAALHAAHTLSIPVKLGVKVVARTQALTWSLQHSLSYLESAFLLSKWVDMILAETSAPHSMPMSEDEKHVFSYVQSILDEGEVDDAATPDALLAVRLVRLWARLLGQESIWPIVSLICKILTCYAGLLAAKV